MRTARLVIALIPLCVLAACSTPVATPTPAPTPALREPTTSGSQAPAVYSVRLSTTKGDVVIQVHRDWAANGADRFYQLVKAGFYDKAKVFRAIPAFMVQFGLSGDPSVTREWLSNFIADDPVKQSNLREYVTFAMAGPNTRTTQIFVNLADNRRLDPRGFAPFGKVVSGMDVVDKLYTGYGEGAPGGKGPDQARIESEGNPYLEKDFPLLDAVVTARIVP